MKKLRYVIAWMCLVSVLFAKFTHQDLPRAPREEDIGQFLAERTDTQPPRKMSREEFLGFFRSGRFVGIETWRKEGARYEGVRSDQSNAPKGIPVFCQGAFATKSGEVFLWRLVREKVLEIEDTEHRTGWLILDTLPKK